MKKTKLIGCIVISIIAILIIVICDRPSAVIKMENDSPVMKFEGQGGYQDTLTAWYNEKDGNYYFFLPTYVKEAFECIEVEGQEQEYVIGEDIIFEGKNIRVCCSANLSSCSGAC